MELSQFTPRLPASGMTARGGAARAPILNTGGKTVLAPRFYGEPFVRLVQRQYYRAAFGMPAEMGREIEEMPNLSKLTR